MNWEWDLSTEEEGEEEEERKRTFSNVSWDCFVYFRIPFSLPCLLSSGSPVPETLVISVCFCISFVHECVYMWLCLCFGAYFVISTGVIVSVCLICILPLFACIHHVNCAEDLDTSDSYRLRNKWSDSVAWQHKAGVIKNHLQQQERVL